jgi:hypothetical protein
MATNHAHDSGEERNPSVGYDKSDLGARGILIFFLVLAVFAVALNLMVVGMYVGMTRIADKHDPEMSPLAPKAVAPRSGVMTNTADVNLQKFPEPRLQNDDTGDMTRFLQKETAALTAEPWQDAQGNVHLPIDEAMKVVVTRLPVRTGNVAPVNYPGAARPYSYPTTAEEATTKQDNIAPQEKETQETHAETETPLSTK